jgi:hypothetical protein
VIHRILQISGTGVLIDPLYTPARAGGLLEEQQRTQRKFASMNGFAVRCLTASSYPGA